VKVATKVGATLVALAAVLIAGQFWLGENGKLPPPPAKTESQEKRVVRITLNWGPDRGMKVDWLVGTPQPTDNVHNGVKWTRKFSSPVGTQIQVGMNEVTAHTAGAWKTCMISFNGKMDDEGHSDRGTPLSCSAVVH
jgi:hypothetical protein